MTALHFTEAPPLLSLLIFLPLAGAVGLFASTCPRFQRGWTLAVTLLCLPLAWKLHQEFEPASALFQFAEHREWIPWLNLHYTLGVDGISLLMVLLTVLVMPLCVLASWRYIEKRVRAFCLCLLLMETAMIGVFCALDALLFFVFWEAMLIPMALIIGIWGGSRKEYAAIKFFIYTMAGSVFMLVALLVVGLHIGSLHIPDMMAAGGHLSYSLQIWVFLACLVAFAIKVPMIPFHTWLPAAHVEAPTAGSILLASVLLKMGTYGMLRFCLPVTPEAAVLFAPYIMALSVVAILYGALVALAQTDLKKIVAYSSVAHMGFATLGIFCLNEQGIQGALLVMLNHGITTGALFLMVGMLYERLHTRELGALAGVGAQMPVFSLFFALFCLSSMAFPGTNSFVGEFQALAGAFHVSLGWALAAIPGVVVVAAYTLRMLQKITFGGPDNPTFSALEDLSWREKIALLPLAFLVLWIGLHPQPVLRLVDTCTQHLLSQTLAR